MASRLSSISTGCCWDLPKKRLAVSRAAREAYVRAAAFYPRAQSPRLALSALATRMGDRKEALAAIEPLFRLPEAAAERDDPWWIYLDSAGRNADALLAEMRRPFERENP